MSRRLSGSVLRSRRHACGVPAVGIGVATMCALVGCTSPDASTEGGAPTRENTALAPAKSAASLTTDGVVATGPPDVPSPAFAAAPPSPPGIEPAVLRVRPTDDSAARRTLASMMPPTPFITPIELPAANDADEAALALARGVDALEQGKALMAVTELEKAHRADSGSTEILRQLARALSAAGGGQRSGEAYLRLLERDPDDPEALYSVAMGLLNQRAFEGALPPLLALWQQLATGRAAAFDALGAEAPMVIGHALSMALRQLGHDRASIDAAVVALAAELPERATGATPLRARAEESLRHRPELLSVVGDAWCRLGDPQRAFEAYDAAGAVAPAGATGMLARRLHALIWLGRHRDATNEFVAHVAADPGRVNRQDAALAGWLADQLPDRRALAEALRRLAEADPDHPALLWVAAGAAPANDAVALLHASLAAQPRDLAVTAELLHGLAEQRLELAVSLAIELLVAHPVDAEPVVERLIAVRATPAALRSAVASATPSAGRDATQAWLVALSRDPGEAWRHAQSALERDPQSPLLHAAQIGIAGHLEEVSLVDEAVRRAREAGAWERVTAIAEIDARLRCRQWARAEEAAADVVFDWPRDPDVLAAAATASLLNALALPSGSVLRTAAAEDAQRLATTAVEIDPHRQRAWEALLRVHDPRSGLVPDVERVRDTVDRMQAIDAEDPLLERLVAMEEIARGRAEQAVARLVALWERQPVDDEIIRLLLQAWARQGHIEQAEEWFRAQLARSPSSPRLADALVAVLVQRGAADEAESLLRQRLADDPEDGVALWLLETVLRSAGAPEAPEFAQRRLQRRPDGPRRMIELASVAIDRGAPEEAMTELARLRDAAASLSLEQIVVALTVSERLPDGMETDRLRLALATGYLDRELDAPTIVHGLAIASAARLDAAGSPSGLSTDALIDGFARSTAGRASGPETASQWAVLAQRLVESGRADVAASAIRRRLADALTQDDATARATATLAVTADVAAGDWVAAVEMLTALATHQPRLGWPPRDVRSAVPAPDAPDDQPWDAAEAERNRLVADVLVWASGRWSLLGRAGGAKELLRAALRLDPTHMMAKNNLGYAMLEARHAAGVSPDAETAQLIEEAAAALPESASVVDSLGWLRYFQGRFTDGDDGPGAVTLLLQAMELSGDEPSAEVFDHLGDAMWRVGRQDDARSLWEAGVLLLDQDYPAARTIPRLATMMSQEFGLLIEPPQAIWDRLYGDLLRRLRAKLDAAAAGVAPPVATIVGAD